jgi:hypothetical protein
MKMKFHVTWIDQGQEPRVSPNPAYPEGIDLDITDGQEPNCMTALPYPAKRIGYYRIWCRQCGIRVACTTAGRIDDPRTIRVACKNGKIPDEFKKF